MLIRRRAEPIFKGYFYTLGTSGMVVVNLEKSCISIFLGVIFGFLSYRR